MIRTDMAHQWADTTMAAVQSDGEWPPRRPFIPQGCDQQGRLTPTIEPAHAAGALPEPEDREPPRTAREAVELAEAIKHLAIGIGAVLAVIGAVSLVAWVGRL